jgi:hypothetical protein
MSDHLIGLTPMLKRFAFHFLLKGVGSHAVEPPYNAIYDEVIVRELYPWHSPRPGVDPQGGLAVEFWYLGKKVRWVEFSVRDTGGGGDPILREMEPDTG